MVGNIPPSSGDTSPIYSNYNPVNPTDGQNPPSYHEQFQDIVNDPNLTRDEKFAKLDALKDELYQQAENLPKDQQFSVISTISAEYNIAMSALKDRSIGIKPRNG